MGQCQAQRSAIEATDIMALPENEQVAKQIANEIGAVEEKMGSPLFDGLNMQPEEVMAYKGYQLESAPEVAAANLDVEVKESPLIASDIPQNVLIGQNVAPVAEPNEIYYDTIEEAKAAAEQEKVGGKAYVAPADMYGPKNQNNYISGYSTAPQEKYEAYRPQTAELEAHKAPEVRHAGHTPYNAQPKVPQGYNAQHQGYNAQPNVPKGYNAQPNVPQGYNAQQPKNAQSYNPGYQPQGYNTQPVKPQAANAQAKEAKGSEAPAKPVQNNPAQAKAPQGNDAQPKVAQGYSAQVHQGYNAPTKVPQGYNAQPYHPSTQNYGYNAQPQGYSAKPYPNQSYGAPQYTQPMGYGYGGSEQRPVNHPSTENPASKDTTAYEDVPAEAGENPTKAEGEAGEQGTAQKKKKKWGFFGWSRKEKTADVAEVTEEVEDKEVADKENVATYNF